MGKYIKTGRPRGGAMPGAGRPRSNATIAAAELRMRLVLEYEKRADEIFGALLRKAVEGDVPAIKELHDRVYGKATQAIEMSGTMTVNHLERLRQVQKILLAENEK